VSLFVSKVGPDQNLEVSSFKVSRAVAPRSWSCGQGRGRGMGRGMGRRGGKGEGERE